jgi:hypothetical protein
VGSGGEGGTSALMVQPLLYVYFLVTLLLRLAAILGPTFPILLLYLRIIFLYLRNPLSDAVRSKCTFA